MKISYYPGCTLKTSAKNFEDSTLCSLTKLGIEVAGAPPLELLRNRLFPRHGRPHPPCRAGPQPDLRQGGQGRRAADPLRHVLQHPQAGQRTGQKKCRRPGQDQPLHGRRRMAYEGDVKVLHLLELLRDDRQVRERRQKSRPSPDGLKVASYYGCLLVRPKEIGLDDMENPQVLDNLMAALGAQSRRFPVQDGVLRGLSDGRQSRDRRRKDLQDPDLGPGPRRGRRRRQLSALRLQPGPPPKGNLRNYPDFKKMPILYFTQLLAIALGCREEALRFDLHYVDPKPVLKQKGLI